MPRYIYLGIALISLKIKMSKLSKEDIKHIASLAKLTFSDNELESISNEFNSILDYISMIQECDTSEIEFEHNIADHTGNVLQEDIVKAGFTNQDAISNATEGRSQSPFILTSKIINKE